MEELNAEQISNRRAALLQLQIELEALLVATRDGTRPVELDEPIGRLTRMDAIQQQSVTSANRASADLRLRQVLQALKLMERDEYGICRRCEEPIGFARLEARPESPYCIECQDMIDRKRR